MTATDVDKAAISWPLVQRAQAGDQAAVADLYRRYGDTVFRFVYFRVGNRPLAEDLASEAWLRALKRIDSFTWQGRDFGAWLVTIARNLIADHFKSGRFRLEVTTGDVLDADREDRGPEGSPETAVLDYLTNVELLKAVRSLNTEQRECIVLRFLRGHSVAETAAQMGKKEGAIKALQYRATRSLARMFPDAHDFGLPEPVLDDHRDEDRDDPDRAEVAAVRSWAAGEGIFVSPRGRVSYRLVDAYRAARVTS